MLAAGDVPNDKENGEGDSFSIMVAVRRLLGLAMSNTLRRASPPKLL
jgi:hypothetical protein